MFVHSTFLFKFNILGSILVCFLQRTLLKVVLTYKIWNWNGEKFSSKSGNWSYAHFLKCWIQSEECWSSLSAPPRSSPEPCWTGSPVSPTAERGSHWWAYLTACHCSGKSPACTGQSSGLCPCWSMWSCRRAPARTLQSQLTRSPRQKSFPITRAFPLADSWGPLLRHSCLCFGAPCNTIRLKQTSQAAQRRASRVEPRLEAVGSERPARLQVRRLLRERFKKNRTTMVWGN